MSRLCQRFCGKTTLFPSRKSCVATFRGAAQHSHDFTTHWWTEAWLLSVPLTADSVQICWNAQWSGTVWWFVGESVCQTLLTNQRFPVLLSRFCVSLSVVFPSVSAPARVCVPVKVRESRLSKAKQHIMPLGVWTFYCACFIFKKKKNRHLIILKSLMSKL